MSKKVTCLVTGILFGIALCLMGYLYMVLSIALSLAKAPLIDIFFVLTFVLYPLGIISIVGSSLIFKKPKATKIMLLISLIYFVLISIYFIISISFSIIYVLLLVAVLILGLVSTILSFLIKKENVNIKEKVLINENTNIS